jgi:3-isopropylmalate dehydrogenase
MYEPAGGSAPDIAGKNIANPLAQILSAAMLLRYSCGLTDAADAIEKAVESCLSSGLRTQDIFQDGADEQLVSTSAMGDAVVSELAKY